MTLRPASSDHTLRPLQFATTSWSMIATAQGKDGDSRGALEELCSVYWYPLYAWLRRKGNPRENAEDLVQGFFAALLDGERLQKADAARGRFRSWLLTSLDHFVTSQWRQENALKRGGGKVLLALDFSTADSRYAIEASDEAPPDEHFDRLWAIELLNRAMSRVESEYQESGKGRLFAALQPQLAGEDAASLSKLCDELTMSLGALRVAAHRLRQRFRATIRELVAQTVLHEEEIDEEIAALFRALG